MTDLRHCEAVGRDCLEFCDGELLYLGRECIGGYRVKNLCVGGEEHWIYVCSKCGETVLISMTLRK